ncbi:MAG: AmmeMemoRadiSam system protein B [Candidatus Omnitrophica bacterium]|nr:AmmeMemoRadiSam system protein B [Candidatus Omnitrophota bacterium]
MLRKTAFTTAIICLTGIFFVLAGEAKLADLAGSWYSSDPVRLRAELENYLAGARVPRIHGRVLGVIAPHAGYRYSGRIAAHSFELVRRSRPRDVIIVGFSHRKYRPGKIAVFSGGSFKTPLGRSMVNRELSSAFLEYSGAFSDMPDIFSGENSIELEIPFVQAAAKDARLVLIALCDQRWDTIEALSDALYGILKDRKDFIMVASTDLCHYLDHEKARRMDSGTIQMIEKFDPRELYLANLKKNNELMCGTGAVCSVMAAAKKLGADRVKILKYANSGDTAGGRGRVVGYLSAAFIDSGNTADVTGQGEERAESKRGRDMFTIEQKKRLLDIARNSIEDYLGTGRAAELREDDEVLKRPMGAFVTLHKKGALRGCIGNMAATGPLCETVKEMAISAAVKDPRFPPVTLEEIKDIDIEISALSPMKKIDDPDDIEMGKHGVMVKSGWRSGVYLPQVADETGWTREEFMNSLCAHKAGLPADHWKTGKCDIYVFTAEVFGEKEFD